MKRHVILIVLDSFGIGAAPDARLFGDEGCSTLESLQRTGKLEIPNMIKMGLGNIDGVSCLPKKQSPTASYGRLEEVSQGKDTTVGHWEIAGLISHAPQPTYKDGFPASVIDAFVAATGRGVLCNKPYSGTDVIRDFGDEHLRTGKLIVYTSQDSVFQIAAHEECVPPEKLYEYCLAARKILSGEHSVGRVIARPFIGECGEYKRTANRRDFSLLPSGETMLDKIKASGKDVISVGKISDIFAGSGITESHPTHSNEEGMQVTSMLAEGDFSGLLFVNLVDFDSQYGHRQDALGYALAMSEFDRWLGEFLQKLKEDDLLIITADHGCDPSDTSTDHTREYTPLLVFDGKASKNLGTKRGFYNIARLVTEALGVDFHIPD